MSGQQSAYHGSIQCVMAAISMSCHGSIQHVMAAISMQRSCGLLAPEYGSGINTFLELVLQHHDISIIPAYCCLLRPLQSQEQTVCMQCCDDNRKERVWPTMPIANVLPHHNFLESKCRKCALLTRRKCQAHTNTAVVSCGQTSWLCTATHIMMTKQLLLTHKHAMKSSVQIISPVMVSERFLSPGGKRPCSGSIITASCPLLSSPLPSPYPSHAKAVGSIVRFDNTSSLCTGTPT